MNTILLEPTDVLFFRDGRPMTGASSGHGAAWPLPTVINHAFHAALHRAGEAFSEAHVHRPSRNGVAAPESARESAGRRFGSLVTAGPFPVQIQTDGGVWHFPRPADAGQSFEPQLLPYSPMDESSMVGSSLPAPCLYPVVSTLPPSKEALPSWWNESDWNTYLGSNSHNPSGAKPEGVRDSHFTDTEHTYGIGLDPETGTVVEGLFYSANYLRLRPGWRLGVFAEAIDKTHRHPQSGQDLVRTLLNGDGTQILTGGQQRVCTARLDPNVSGRLPLPLGRTQDFYHDAVTADLPGRWLVKWVLLTPAIWPAIASGVSRDNKPIRAHPGGWLPNWVFLNWDESRQIALPHDDNGRVLLTTGPGARKALRKKLDRGSNINAWLVAALVPKAQVVTGWALPNDRDRAVGGAKRTLLAAPAGSVFYFAAESREDAEALAAVLNWHGNDPEPRTIRNRRSTLYGEKGFGLGVCASWKFHKNPIQSQSESKPTE